MTIALKLVAAVVGYSLMVWGFLRWSKDGHPNAVIALFAGPPKSRLAILALLIGFYLGCWGGLSLLMGGFQH
jgi:hypothetical protein